MLFIKERDKQLLTRTAVIELVQALKFKTAIPDANFLMLTNLVLLDAGGAIAIGTEFADSFPKVRQVPDIRSIYRVRHQLRPRFCVLITEVLLCLPDSAWACGNLAGWA